MQTSWLVVFVILIFVFIKFQVVWLAVLLGIVIIIDFLSMLGKTGKDAITGFGSGVKEDLKREYEAHEKADPKYPSGETFVSLVDELAKKVAPGKEKPKKKNVIAVVSKGSSELIKTSKEFFKK